MTSVWRRLRRPALVSAALAFAAATLLYNGLWMAAMHWGMPGVELGYESDSGPAEQVIRNVQKGSPAEAAGLRPGDRIYEIDGNPWTDAGFQVREWMRRHPGDRVRLSVRRPGVPEPIELTAIFRKRVSLSNEVSVPERVANEFRRWYPAPFVLVGLIVLFLRIDDWRVWLLSALLAGFAVQPGGYEQIPQMAPWSGRFALVYRTILHSLFPPLFYWFCATFPVRSALDRRAPWLKWAAFGGGLPDAWVAAIGAPLAMTVLAGFGYGLFGLGLGALAWTYFRTPEGEARRKIRVVFWGAFAGVIPALLSAAARDLAHFQPPWWVDTAMVAFLFLVPLSLAYAVVRHRVLEIPLLLQRSARYMLVQRGFTFLLLLVSLGLTAAFAAAYGRSPGGRAATPESIAVGVVFGTVLVWRVSDVHRRVSGRIDRAFFRQAYDARVILEDLAEQIGGARDRGEIAALLERHLRSALQPDSIVLYFRDRDGRLAPLDGGRGTLVPDLPLLVELARSRRPWECPEEGPEAAMAGVFKPFRPDCVVALPGRGGRLAGLLALGRRRSDAPYSGEDFRLLASVAAQAGVALENLRLAEEIAARREAERIAAREMEIAREVQSRLLPQSAPALRTLDCAARCIQARSVGGDYYDLLRLGASRVAIVLGDVAGKGVHAALLMANLQAQVRSLAPLNPLDPATVLRQVNRRLWDSTAPEHYVTMFFGVYDDETRHLTYVNCGHNPPIRIGGEGVERLPATATVLGIFERWDCEIGQIVLEPGDVLAIYSDGITEAPRGDEEEYGEPRLIAALESMRNLAAEDVVARVLADVQEFSSGAQADDLTLVLARGKA